MGQRESTNKFDELSEMKIEIESLKKAHRDLVERCREHFLLQIEDTKTLLQKVESHDKQVKWLEAIRVELLRGDY